MPHWASIIVAVLSGGGLFQFLIALWQSFTGKAHSQRNLLRELTEDTDAATRRAQAYQEAYYETRNLAHKHGATVEELDAVKPHLDEHKGKTEDNE